MPKFDVSGPFERAASRFDALRKSIPQVKARASSTLARRLPVQARRDIQDEYNIKAGRIAQDLTARVQGDGVVLTGKARPPGLIEFQGKWGGLKTEGATASVLKSEGPHTYGGTFIATGRNGSRQIFTRASRKGVGGGRSPRLPIAALYGPSIAGMLRKGERAARLGDFAQTILSAEIDRLLHT